jgi:hypothetical protein
MLAKQKRSPSCPNIAGDRDIKQKDLIARFIEDI